MQSSRVLCHEDVCYPPDILHAEGLWHIKHHRDLFVVTLFGPWRRFLTALSPLDEVPLVFSNSLLQLDKIDSWQGRASVVIINFLHALAGPLSSFNSMLEWVLNFLHFNGGVFRIFLLLALGKWDEIIWAPPNDSPAYFSVVGWMDPRLDLIDPAAEFKETNTKSYLDLCVMASKLAYESPHVQRSVLESRWKMCFQKFLDCWNDRAQQNTTEAFIFTDKPKNANLVVVAFRGTEPFDMDDWSTDFDFAWLELDPEVGRIHVGFLEALGLVNRNQFTTFDHFKQNCLSALVARTNDHFRRTTGLMDQDAQDQEGGRILAFDAINKELRRLIKEHPDARISLTGHSLGGALALVFAGVLMFKKGRDHTDDKILERLDAIHTFGQPRVGDAVFSNFLNKSMIVHSIEYYRIVYSNDMIARIPFDNGIFGFKHAGHICYYYDSFFRAKVLKEVPNKNFFSPSYFVRMWVTAVFELLRSILFMTMSYGVGFKETVLMTMLRLFGLVFPGLSAHMPVNYVNSVRLGPEVLLPFPDGEGKD